MLMERYDFYCSCLRVFLPTWTLIAQVWKFWKSSWRLKETVGAGWVSGLENWYKSVKCLVNNNRLRMKDWVNSGPSSRSNTKLSSHISHILVETILHPPATSHQTISLQAGARGVATCLQCSPPLVLVFVFTVDISICVWSYFGVECSQRESDRAVEFTIKCFKC